MCDFDIMERNDSNTYMTNYVRLCYVAQYENRKLLEELLHFETSQKQGYAHMDPQANKELQCHLTKENMDLIHECFKNQSFAKLNLNVIYVVLRYSDLIDPPYHGWNQTPRTATNTIGDCVDLIQQKYHLIFHSGRTDFTDEEVIELFSLFKGIARKFELYLHKKEGELVSRYDKIELCCFDVDMRTKYRKHLHLLESGLKGNNQQRFYPNIYETDSFQLSTEVTNTLRVTYAIQVILTGDVHKYMTSLKSPADFRREVLSKLQLFNSCLPKHLQHSIYHGHQHGYENFSISVIRKLLNHMFTNDCINLSENVTAILSERDSILSRANASMNDAEMVECFKVLKKIAKDLEHKMKKVIGLTTGKFVAELEYYKTCCMDGQISKWYHDSLRDLAERDEQLGTPNTDWTTRFWYLSRVSFDHLPELTPYDPVSRYVLIGYAFEVTLSEILKELLSHQVPHCLLFSKLFSEQHFEYFNAEDYLLFLESQKNGYLDFDTMLLASVLLCLKKTRDNLFLVNILKTKHQLLNKEKKELNKKEMKRYLSFFKDVATRVENILLSPKGKFDSLFEQLQNPSNDGQYLGVLFASSVEEAQKQRKPMRMRSKHFIQTPSSSLLDSKEFYDLLVNGSYISYDNRVYLGGPCNAGKTSLACIFTGDEVPGTWISTNGLQIYFGRNGIHLKDKKMIPIRKGMHCHTVHGKVISALDEMRKEDQATKSMMEKDDKKENADLKEDGSFHNLELIDRNTDSQSDIKDKLDIIKRLDMQTPTLDNNAMGESKKSDTKEVKTSDFKTSTKALSVIQEEALHKIILDEVRRGEYNLEVAPSDLVDFGGQKAFDMTHQLFIMQKGTVLLLFDGSKDLDKPLPEYHGKNISSADILHHWVDSVSIYCTEDSGMQRIQFVATHRDKYKDNFEKRRNELVTQLTAIFHKHEKRSFLSFDNLFFIDARNKDDNEIDKLKDELVQIAFSQTSWGQKMPLIWVPLETQIADLKLRGTSILRIEEIQKLNKSNEDLMMDDEKLYFFLRTQHAIGKFVYFDQDYELAKFVIIEPSVLVNALRSFVTDEMFFPKNDTECYHILKKLQLEGMLKKNDLLKLWNQDEFKSIFQDQDDKDFIAKILLRLDVLVEPTLLNHDVNISLDYYIVPCMIQTGLDNDYAEKYLNINKSICMAYVFKVQMVLPCVFFRLIASAVGIWPFKEYQERKMFFRDIATFVYDENNEFSLIMDGRTIVVYFTNSNSIQKIQQPKVASVQECLSMAIKSITEFYQIHSGSSYAFDVKMFEKPIELEYGAACKAPCFFEREEELRLSKVGMWKCKHGQSHEANYLWYWDSKKNYTKTSKKMTDILPIVLMEKPPADLLRKLSFAVGKDGDRLGLNLGLESSVIENMVISNRYNIFEKTLKILEYWKMFGESVTVEHLSEGLQTIGGRGIETIVEYYRYQNTADLPHVRTTASDLQSLSFKSPVMRCRSNSLPSLRSPLENNKEGKDWFYKLKIYCDMYDLHLIIDRTLETQYKSLAETVNQKDILTSLIEKKKCSKSFMSVFEKIYQLTICPISTFSEESICEQNELLFRFILARNLSPFKVINLLRQAMEDQMHKLCKAFSWYILRSMIKETSISDFFSQVKDIWPGFFCKCSERKKGHSAICSKEPVIVIDADEYLEGLPGDIYGIPVKQSAYYLATENAQESDTSIEQNSSGEEMPTVSGNIAQELFLLHTKLTLIYKSITEPWCVRLCCEAKGIIPMGEEHLPVVVCGMNTKVLHGNVSNLHKMHVGSKIGHEKKVSWGTLGGFVQRRGRNAFLTCSHVIYDREQLLCENKRDKNREEVQVKCYFNGDTNTFICGYVIDDVFEYEKTDKTSIDAAVVVLDIQPPQLESSIDETGIVQISGAGLNPSLQPVSFLGMTSAYVNDNYKTHEIKKGVMKARLVGANSGYFERDVKYEDFDAIKSNFKGKLQHGVIAQWAELGEQFDEVVASNPKPIILDDLTHFQTTLIPKLDEAVKHDRQFVRFYNQLLMENLPFEKGDSGTCIYIVEDKSHTKESNEANSTGCIGMAIASNKDPRDNNSRTIVTPMEAILEALRLI